MERKSYQIKQELFKFQAHLEALISCDSHVGSRIYQHLDNLERNLNLILITPADTNSNKTTHASSSMDTPSQGSIIITNNVFVPPQADPAEKPPKANDQFKNKKKNFCNRCRNQRQFTF